MHDEVEKRIAAKIAKRQHISRNINQALDDERTFGQRLADRIAAFGGSWTFLISFACVLAGWVILNSLILANSHTKPFDPYPYILLNLFLSMLASVQAPIIMMSQNRQAARDRVDASKDYEVNLKSELEIASLHDKLDQLRDQQWNDLIALQKQQLELLSKVIEAVRR
ncbi:MAG TPA: DUF1003 domain-containing protein [Thermoanaerobaculia bacterium]